jgi:phosphate transport system permease protein
MKFIVYLTCILIFCAYVWLLVPILESGASSFNFDYLSLEPTNLGRSGGIGPIITNTILINLFAVSIVLIIGMPTALYIVQSETTSFKMALELCLDLLAATPSIIFGLFGFAFFARSLGLGYSILSGSLSLSIMILPFIIRIFVDILKESHLTYWNSAKTIGLSSYVYTFKILLPNKLPSLVSALILAWTKAMSETAVLLFTAGYATRWIESPLDSGRSLGVHIYELSMNISGGEQMANQSAFVLLSVTMIFIFIARIFLWSFKPWHKQIMH